MEKGECTTCREYKNCRDSFVSWFFFIVGLIATVAIRIVTVVMHMDPVYGKLAWYIGVGGFFLFFVYKFKVNQARLKAISRRNLVDRINQQQLTGEDYNLIKEILCGLSSNKERINYIFIFVLSALALLLAIYMDFIR